MNGKSSTRNASSKSEANAAAVRRPPGAIGKSNDFVASSRPGTSHHRRPTGNCETKTSFPNTLVFTRSDDTSQDKANAAAVRRPPGANRKSNDFASSPRPGTSLGRPTGNGETKTFFPNTLVFTRSDDTLQNKTNAAVPKLSGRTTQATAAYQINKNPAESIFDVMNKVTSATLFRSAKVLLNVLVEADASKPTEFWCLVEDMVQKVIGEQWKSNMYAHLFSEAYRKSLVDERLEVRTAFGDRFKRDLIAVCCEFQNVAWTRTNSKRSSHTRPRFGAKRVDNGREPGRIDYETRKRTLGASRLLGELYAANTFKILDAVTANVDALMRAGDENSLECLCVLMTEIGPKFEKVEASTAKKVYAELRNAASRSNKTLPARTKTMIDKLLRLPGKSDGAPKNSVDDSARVKSIPVSRQPEISRNAKLEPKTSRMQNVAGTSGDEEGRPNISITSNEKLIHSVAAVMENLTEDTVVESSRVFLDILVKANEDKHLNFGLVMNYIVQKAVDNAASSHLYACLCSEANRNASKDTRDSVRNRFPEIFKIGLMRSCNKVLWEAGIQSQARSSGLAKMARIPKEINATTRVRTLQTCRFMGHLFLVNAFKMHDIVSRTVDALLKARDEHSLECLCALLTIIGPKFELVDDAAALNSAKRVYEQLERLAFSGYAENTLCLRIVQTINRLLRSRDHYWASQKRVVFQKIRRKYHGISVHSVELKETHRRHPERPVNTEGPVRNADDDKRGTE